MHKNATVIKFYMKNYIKCIEWSSISFDLYPIKILCGLINEKLSKSKYKNQAGAQR